MKLSSSCLNLSLVLSLICTPATYAQSTMYNKITDNAGYISRQGARYIGIGMLGSMSLSCLAASVGAIAEHFRNSTLSNCPEINISEIDKNGMVLNELTLEPKKASTAQVLSLSALCAGVSAVLLYNARLLFQSKIS